MNSTFSSTAYEPSQWRLNWHGVAEDISQAGIKFTQQAIMLGREWSTFQRWLQGTEPKYSDAHAWLTLHTHMCGTAATQKRLNEPLKQE